MGRSYKREAVQLRKAMKTAGFMISGAVDESIELLLERLIKQRVEVAVEVTVNKDVLPSVMAVTQDYVIVAKRYPFKAYADEFRVSTREAIELDIKPLRAPSVHTPRSMFSASLAIGVHFGCFINDYHNNDRFGNQGIYQIADWVTAKYTSQPTRPGQNGPSL